MLLLYAVSKPRGFAHRYRADPVHEGQASDLGPPATGLARDLRHPRHDEGLVGFVLECLHLATVIRSIPHGSEKDVDRTTSGSDDPGDDLGYWDFTVCELDPFVLAHLLTLAVAARWTACASRGHCV
jgi:hypothetical protein